MQVAGPASLRLGARVLAPAAARAARPVGAVARAAFPAGGVGEPPGLVGAIALVGGHDLAGGQSDAGEYAAHLPHAAAGSDQRRAHLLAALAGLGNLRKHKLVRQMAL